MRKLSLTLTFFLLMTLGTVAQRYAYVDTEYILSNIPEYSDAQNYLDELSVIWQQEIEMKFTEIARLYEKYQNEAVLLPQELKNKREDEIVMKEREVQEMQRAKFGQDGELNKKRKELVQPIQEKIYNVIEQVAIAKNYSFVFDKAGGLSILYSDPKLDISDDILDQVGTIIQTIRKEDRIR